MSDVEYNDFSDTNSDGESLNDYKKKQPFKKKPTISSYEDEDNDEDNIDVDEDIEDENNIELDDFEDDEIKNDGDQGVIGNNEDVDEEDIYQVIDDDDDDDDDEDDDEDEDEDQEDVEED